MSTPSFRIWLATTRPKTLPAAAAPVVLGSALAHHAGAFHLPSGVAALTFALLIQIGTNFANDYFDHHQGADTDARQGPRRALQQGVVTASTLGWVTAATFLLAALVSLYLLSRAGWSLAVVAVLSIVCGVWYTAGKKSLAYLGIADLFVVVFFGPVAVAGTYLAHTRLFAWTPVLAGLSTGLIATGLLVINNLRDVDEDRAASKRTLAVRFGRTFVRWEYTAVVFLAVLIPGLLVGRGLLPPGVLITGFVWLLALPTVKGVWTLSGAALNPLLGATGRLLLLFTVLFCGGLWW